jgi:hypothetical protein
MAPRKLSPVAAGFAEVDRLPVDAERLPQYRADQVF